MCVQHVQQSSTPSGHAVRVMSRRTIQCRPAEMPHASMLTGTRPACVCTWHLRALLVQDARLERLLSDIEDLCQGALQIGTAHLAQASVCHDTRGKQPAFSDNDTNAVARELK